MIDWLNDNSGAVQAVAVVVLVVVTGVYAWRTHDISTATQNQAEAAREQAKASVKMVREMQEQRLSTRQPNVILALEGTDPPKLVYVPGKTPKAELEGFPRNVRLRANNHGPGVALALSAMVYFREVPSFPCELGMLWPDHPWDCEMSPGLWTGEDVIPTPEGILRDLGADVATCHAAVTVNYRDVHGRTWVSYMALHLVRDFTGDLEEPGEQVLHVEQGDFGIRPPTSARETLA